MGAGSGGDYCSEVRRDETGSLVAVFWLVKVEQVSGWAGSLSGDV